MSEMVASAPPMKSLWWKAMEVKIGFVPLPIFLALLVLIVGFVAVGSAPPDIMMNLALLTVGGLTCAEIGKHFPLLNRVGAAAIFATFVPSYLVFAHLLPAIVVNSVTVFTKSSNVLYLFISSVIVGSILGMDRRHLVTGFLKICIPLTAGSLVACAVGLLVGAALGLEIKHTFFFIVAPIMAGGIGEGALPLAAGYASFHVLPPGELLGEILPSVMFGSLTAILFSGMLNRLGKAVPRLTGEQKLAIGCGIEIGPENAAFISSPVHVIAAATVLIAALYLTGQLSQLLLGWPGPVIMLFLTVLLKLARVIPPALEHGTFSVFQFFRTAVTYPLLFAIGVAMTPWKNLVAALHPASIMTIIATVAALVGTGFVTARLVGMYPIDVAIVNACHSGQGGTGDVAILTAANRMHLMPFAQIATRIGGAITVTLALILFARLG
jgi:malate:Na+ symporter